MDEIGFRSAVLNGLPFPTGLAAGFALNHEEIAIPILVDAIKVKLTDAHAESDKSIHRFIQVAAKMVMYNGSQRAIDAAADLCSIDQKDCPWLVTMLLDGARTRQHPYATAYDIVEQYPNLLDLVVPWVERGQIGRAHV